MKFSAKSLIRSLAVLVVIAGTRLSFSESPDEFFEKNVRPVLVDQCYKCHSADAKKLKGGLRVDARELLLKGGETGPAMVPGDPDKSLLVKAIHRVDEDSAMPPKDALPQKDVDALTAWVKMGAPWPVGDKPATTASDEAAKKHWAFQSVKMPAVPAISELLNQWVKNPIDAFVAKTFAGKKLQPSPDADKQTLIRRVTFDLTGLPPDARDVSAFLADPSPDAYEKIVDKLLASPQYGERWARHWLDVARYADHKGYLAGGEERRYPFAYSYRDWVIDAFNQDKPYDQFLIDQIAADQVATGDDKRDLAAMGFLTVGRRFLNSQPEIIDDRIDVICRGTMGLTVACARCHNHKFDPIPTADYYSLYGVLASSEEPKDLPLLGAPPQTPEYEAWEKELSARQKVVDDYKAANPETNRKTGDEIHKLEGKVQAWHMDANAPPRGMVMVDKPQPVKPHIFLRGNQANHGPEVPRQFLKILSGDDRKPFTKGSGRLELAQAIANKNNPLTARVFVNRVWLHHFGKPLVRTPSDFGVRTEPPANPELLDFLAAKFMDDGWSVKKLHRLIVLSRTYRQSTSDNSANRVIDPDNQFVWRQNLQRLDFEETRDAMLAAGGQLDPKMGGPAVPLFGSEVEVKGENVKPVDKSAIVPFSHRRTVYGFIDRQNLPGVFRTFDFASPDAHSPQRFTTTVPQQALFMLNSPFILELARQVVARPEVATARSDADRINMLYRVILQRAPQPGEVELARQFLAKSQAGETPPQPTWDYGWGDFDEATKRVKFTALRYFGERKSWQVAKDLPEAELGYISLHKTGGHPGRDAQHAVIRRWTAPRDGEFAIVGTLVHPAQVGDGVRGRIVLSSAGVASELGSWIAKYNQTETRIERVVLKCGDTLDFLVDCREGDNSDGFGWAPIIRALKPAANTDTQIVSINGMEWSAANEFTGPAVPPAKPLTPWEKYAQALLAANEFVFVE